MNIALDMMGGDFAPVETVKGIRLYLSEAKSPAFLLLIGDEQQLNPLLLEQGIPATAVKVVHAPDTIGMHEHPTRALKSKPHSSISIGFHLLSTGKADALISAGNTGAMLVGSLHAIKAIDGLQRPAISTIIPKENGKTGLLLDVGLNADCKPENLNQFAILGSLYAQHIFDIEQPRVGLLNIGEEEGKGNLLSQGAYPLLKENKEIHFVGNLEGRDVFLDKADVIVCDGFTGNIILKLAESIFGITQRQQVHSTYFDRFNFEDYGGTPVLGIAKPVIIGHGISHGRAFMNMINLAEKIINKDFLQKMKSSFESL